jgi:diguanylate cyclase (GGDEF)-like protein
MARIDPVTLEIKAYRHDPGEATTLSGNAVEAIVIDWQGLLWVGTTTGLNAFDPSTEKAVRIVRDPARRDSLADNWVPDLMFDRGGRLWVAGPAGAHVLTSWDGRTASFTSVAAMLKRRSEPVQSLIEDATGRVWLGASVRVDPERWTFDEFGPADGCSFRNFFFASRSLGRDGRLLFGSPEGLLIVRPERIAAWEFEPEVVATSVSVDGVERRGASALKRLELAPGQKSLRVDFASLDFTAPQRNRYRYRLEGYDDAWVTSDASQRSITYGRLTPGEYTLLVQGTNRAGAWSPRMLRIGVTVRPAFHQTVWFRVIVVAGLLALVYGGYRMRVRQLEARGRMLQRLVDERTAELAEKNRQLESAYARIEEASLTDPLTGLRNRRYLEQTIGADLELALRRSRDEADRDALPLLVFLLVDLDHFKSVNDTYGHAAGDAVLRQTAEVLRAAFRASDHVVRWGGEEFLVVARFVHAFEGAAFGEKLRAAIEQREYVLPDGRTIGRSCSIGFAAFPFLPSDPRGVDWHDVVDIADAALYAVKRSGRNGWAGIWPVDASVDVSAVRLLRDDRAAAAASGAFRVEVREELGAGFRWD